MRFNHFEVQNLIAEKGLTQTEFAQMAGLRRQSLSLILSRGTASLATIGKIAKALDVPVASIR